MTRTFTETIDDASCCCSSGSSSSSEELAPGFCPCSAVDWNAICLLGPLTSLESCNGLVTCYEIDGHTQTTFDPGACSCSNRPAWAHWDGRLHCTSVLCTWDYDGGQGTDVQINGKAGGAILSLLSSPDIWRLDINCTDLGGPTTHTVWRGEKPRGSSPVGIYSRVSGCGAAGSNPSQVELIECLL